MLCSVLIEEKRAGAKLLIQNSQLKLQDREKVGFVGRNGVGKTTLARIILGEDKDFLGKVDMPDHLMIVTTDQEQRAATETTVFDYVLDGLRDYRELTAIIEAGPDSDDMEKIQIYSDALERYATYGYYHVRDQVGESLKAYQLSEAQINGPFQALSGGQKRFAQLVQIEYSNADLLLLDEPTNHMDYVAKANFVEWLKATTSGVLVITHDRDVLAAVDRIIELKDHSLHSFSGDYMAYLKQNASSNVAAMHQYEVDIKTLENRREALRQAQIKKARSKQSPNPFIPLVRRLEKEIEVLEERTTKPTIWIDQASTRELKRGQTEQYEKYKARNITLKDAKHGAVGHASQLVRVDDLSLGYDMALFSDVKFEVRAGERVHVVGRNGAGKTTFVDALCTMAAGEQLECTIYDGLIDCSQGLVIGRYEQEIRADLLDKTLAEALAGIYSRAGRPVNDEVIFQTLAEYLFDRHDGSVPVAQLSGGQKARIQLVALFAHRPNLLILDEPTNHLDLPSIEELEMALKRYDGAILYISHDSYFAEALGGAVVSIDGI